MSTKVDRFVYSMRRLSVGDVVVRCRDGQVEYAAVLNCRDDSTTDGKYLTVSEFQPIMTVLPYPKEVVLKDGWLVDTSGAIMLLPEEWEKTDKEAATNLIGSVSMETKPVSDELSTKQRAILESLANVEKNWVRNAEDIIQIIFGQSASNEATRLLAFALSATAQRIWE